MKKTLNNIKMKLNQLNLGRCWSFNSLSPNTHDWLLSTEMHSKEYCMCCLARTGPNSSGKAADNSCYRHIYIIHFESLGLLVLTLAASSDSVGNWSRCQYQIDYPKARWLLQCSSPCMVRHVHRSHHRALCFHYFQRWCQMQSAAMVTIASKNRGTVLLGHLLV